MTGVKLPVILKKAVLIAYNPVANFYKNKLVKVSHQNHFYQRTGEKWALISPELPAAPGSLLDIGCSEGIFARKAAAMGWRAWGVEAKQEAVSRAIVAAENEGFSNILFASGVLTGEAAQRLPTFDVILLLSVLHQIFKRFGPDQAHTFLLNLLGACSQKLFLEMAAINRKYGQNVLSRENDRASVYRLVLDLVPSEWQVRFLGDPPYTNEEPNRFLYVLERKP